MYKLRVRSDRKCKCGKVCKLYSPKGYKDTVCRCFQCKDCWSQSKTCTSCSEDVSLWIDKIMKLGECTLCLLNKKLRKSPCDHLFCEDCWDETGKRKPECPHCRKDLTKWMSKMGIDIYTKEMFDEDSLPTMDMLDNEEEYRENIVSVLNAINGRTLTISIYSVDD